MESRINGKVALITGATSGIGRSCARELAKLGCNVIITGRRAGMLEAVKMEVEQLGAKAYPLVMDVRDSKDVMDKVNGLPQEWSDIEILVINAGLARGTEKLYEGRIEEFDEAKLKLFIERIIITEEKRVTFRFFNGVEITKEYTNGKSGNKPGWNLKEV